MGARVLRARGSIMSIFKKSFQCVTFLRIFDDVINFWGSYGNQKRTVCVVFQAKYYAKISSTGNKV